MCSTMRQLPLQPKLNWPGRRFCCVGFTIVISLVAAAARIAPAQTEQAQRHPPRAMPLAASNVRARPPVWSVDVLDAFFVNARTMLAGPRPDYKAATADARPAHCARTAEIRRRRSRGRPAEGSGRS